MKDFIRRCRECGKKLRPFPFAQKKEEYGKFPKQNDKLVCVNSDCPRKGEVITQGKQK